MHIKNIPMNTMYVSLCKACSLHFTLAHIGISYLVLVYLYAGLLLEEMDILLSF